VAPPGETVDASRPNLRIQVNPGWARQIAGFLGEAPAITIARSGSGQAGTTFSAAAVEDLRAVHAEPGRNRIRIQLPWGAWTKFVDVPYAGEVACEPPRTLGLPPLRNQAPRDCKAGEILIKGEPRSIMVGDTVVAPQFTVDG